MTDKKYCVCCGAFISDINSADFYSHIRIKYCGDCRKTMSLFQGRNRVQEYRQRQRKIKKLTEDRLNLLQRENELLRQRITKLEGDSDV